MGTNIWEQGMELGMRSPAQWDHTEGQRLPRDFVLPKNPNLEERTTLGSMGLGQLSSTGGTCWGHEIQDWGGTEPFTSPKGAFWVLMLPPLPPQSSVIPLWQGPAHCSVTWPLYFHRDFPPFSNDIPRLSLLPGAGTLQISPVQH